MSDLREAAQAALDAMDSCISHDGGDPWFDHEKVYTARNALRAALAQPEADRQPAGSFDWAPAPTRTEWGAEMVQADVEIDRDHTLSIYAESDQVDSVPAALLRALAQPEPTADGPKLPPSVNWAGPTQLYTADQMLAFRAEGVAQERERCARACESRAGLLRTGAYEALITAADAIRKG